MSTPDTNDPPTTDQFNLPLRPLIEKRDHPDTLPVEIAQINAQWGSFRDVNEDTLRTKIQEEKDKDGIEDEEEGDKAGEVDSTERLEQLYKRRAEITQFALYVYSCTWTPRMKFDRCSQAQMETMFALDFVSLVLSKQAPRQAETSLSAFLKQAVPLGSVNSEVVNPPPKPDTTIQDTKAVSRGWRLQSFDAAANKLLKSATRLEAEVASETRYWSEVLAVKDKGWKVSRLPRERQALGVQYGFLEGRLQSRLRGVIVLTAQATPIFRDRGLASLRRADDGSLILDKGLVPSKTRRIRVRVKVNDKVTGNSNPAKSASSDDQSIEGRILQARDTLYEEELFYELVREARILGAYGVTTRQNLIRFPVSEEQEVMLDLVDADQSSDEGNTDESHDDVLADSIGHSIRILLTFAHRQNLYRRTQPPPPLSQKRRHTPEYLLLRPVLVYLQHNSHVRWMESFLKDIYQVLKSAGVNCDYTATPFASVDLQHKTRFPKVEALIHAFFAPLESTFSGTLITPQSSFKARIRTNVLGHPFGTNHEIFMTMPQHSDIQAPARMGLGHEAAAVLTHFIMLDAVSAIALSRPQGGLTWEAAYPHHGELLTTSPTTGEQKKKMKVTLGRNEMAVQVSGVRAGDRVKMRSQTWNSDQAPQQPGLMEFVADVSKE